MHLSIALVLESIATSYHPSQRACVCVCAWMWDIRHKTQLLKCRSRAKRRKSPMWKRVKIVQIVAGIKYFFLFYAVHASGFCSFFPSAVCILCLCCLFFSRQLKSVWMRVEEHHLRECVCGQNEWECCGVCVCANGARVLSLKVVLELWPYNLSYFSYLNTI